MKAHDEVKNKIEEKKTQYCAYGNMFIYGRCCCFFQFASSAIHHTKIHLNRILQVLNENLLLLFNRFFFSKVNIFTITYMI